MVNPVAFTLGPLSIRWYGIMVAGGFLAGYGLMSARARRYGFKPDDISDLSFMAMLAGIIGARALYVIRYWHEFSGHVLDAFKVYQGGLVFYGGFIGAVIAIVLLTRHRRWSLGHVADLMAPALPLGHAFGRIGCLLNGCCFGAPYNGCGAVRYPAFVEPGIINPVLDVQLRLGVVELTPELSHCAPVFPIQAVAAIGNLMICAALLWLEKTGRCRNRLFIVYMIIYSIARFFLEFGRGDYLTRIAGLTPSQITCLWLLPVAIGIYVFSEWWQRRKNHATSSAGPKQHAGK
ncbi:MAG: prolipoprotein diacylglyceryl transferase [Lentisphaerae bacterium]|jgi:phosphatidylglycerol:prolipoprotein diacylglycerol transferase|nr:prolipoprotein diacylglyceryl transferase [Lentisphaerota bacterium]